MTLFRSPVFSTRVRCSLAAAVPFTLAIGLAACSSDTAVRPSAMASVTPTINLIAPDAHYPGLQVGRMEQWSTDFSGGGVVEINNPHGDVYIRHNRGGSNVGVSGMIQRLGNDPAVEHISVQASDQAVRVEVSYPADAVVPEGFGRIGRVDLAVLVPAGIKLKVTTADGVITGKRVRANIIAETETGKIDLSTTGWVETRTQSGSTQVVLIGDAWSRPNSFSSDTGRIAVEIPTSAIVAIDASSRGALTANPVALEQQLQFGENTLSGHWGSSPEPSHLLVRSGTGDVDFTLYGWMREAAVKPPTANDHDAGN